MENENAAAWKKPIPAGERPDFGKNEVPGHPGHLMPSPVALYRAFSTALEELERRRGREPRRSGYAATRRMPSTRPAYKRSLARYARSTRKVNATIPTRLFSRTKAFPKHR
jgi:hypothetical protein